VTELPALALPDLDLNKARAATALTPPARHLHQWVLTSFVETGHAPPRADLEAMARDHDIDPGPAWSELTGRDVLAVDEQGEIRAAYPFSPVPTRHQVTWDGGTGVHAMCAVDALGMSAMLGVPVTITSTEPDTDRIVTVQVEHDTARWSPDTAVAFAGHTGSSDSSGAACCPSVDPVTSTSSPPLRSPASGRREIPTSPGSCWTRTRRSPAASPSSATSCSHSTRKPAVSGGDDGE